jgi:hypothetical protein
VFLLKFKEHAGPAGKIAAALNKENAAVLYCAQTKNNAIASPKTQLESARSKREIPLIMHYSISTQTNLDDSAGGRSDTRPKVCALLGDGASDGGTLDFTFGVDDDASVV